MCPNEHHRPASTAPGLTRALAAFVAERATQPLPDAAATATARVFANWIGCALGAAGDPALAAVLRVARAQGGAAQSSIVGAIDRFDPVSAALVNGFAGNTLDFDDMHVPTLIHPVATIAPAAFALAEARHLSGAAFARALAIGVEVTCRVGLAMFPAHYDAGWHASSTLGTLGAAAASSALLGLSAERGAHALGIAATQSAGLRAMLGNDCKSFNLGRAAAAGVTATLLAEAGLDSDPAALEARHGLFDVFGWPTNPQAILPSPGDPLLVCAVSLKPYPCGVVIHPLLDACLHLVHTHALDSTRVRRVELFLHPRALDLAGQRHPASMLAGRFSVFHAAALAIDRRSAGLTAFDQTDVHAPSLHALRERIIATASPGIGPGAARVRVQMDDGQAFEHSVEQPSGSPARPLSEARLREKFTELALRSVDRHRVDPLFDACLDIARSPDVASLRTLWVSQ